jgi:hypothetical protein
METKANQNPSFAEILHQIYRAFDLYEKDDRKSNIIEKRSYQSKQDVFKKIILDNLTNCLSGDSNNAKNVLIGLINCFECLFTDINSKPVLGANRHEVYKCYTEVIYTPLIACTIRFLRPHLNVSSPLWHISNFLDQYQDEMVYQKIKATLKEYRDKINKVNKDSMLDVSELIGNIKSNTTQSRTTIEQRFNIAKGYIQKSDPEWIIDEINAMEVSYIGLMALLNFEIKTGLTKKLSEIYKDIGYSDIKIGDPYIISRSETQIISSPPGPAVESVSETLLSIEFINKSLVANVSSISLHAPLFSSFANNFHLIAMKRLKISTTDITQQLIDEINEDSYNRKLIDNIVDTQPPSVRDMLSPITRLCDLFDMLMDEYNYDCYDESEYSQLFDLINETKQQYKNIHLGIVAYFFSVIEIGLKIAKRYSHIKHQELSPLVSEILETQPLYTEILFPQLVDEENRITLSVFMSDDYSRTILRTTRLYNALMTKLDVNPHNCESPAISEALEALEFCLRDAFKNKKIRNQKTLINFLPLANFSNAVLNIDELILSLVQQSPKHLITTQLLSCAAIYRISRYSIEQRSQFISERSIPLETTPQVLADSQQTPDSAEQHLDANSSADDGSKMNIHDVLNFAALSSLKC